MTELIAQLLSVGRRIIGFPVREYWRDIGQLDDYQQAQLEIDGRKVS
jgi:NDP-sugar pyrophosphorylase family protein